MAHEPDGVFDIHVFAGVPMRHGRFRGQRGLGLNVLVVKPAIHPRQGFLDRDARRFLEFPDALFGPFQLFFQ